MSRSILPSIIACGALLAAGCVSARVEGRALTASPTAYRSLAVFCDVEEEAVREEIERAVAENLAQGDVRAVASLDLLTESRVYGPEEVRAVLAEAGCEAMVIIDLDEYYTEVIGYPGSVGTVVSPYGGGVYFEPPSEYDRSVLRIGLEVVDRAADRSVWTGEALAWSSQVHSLDGLASEIARRSRRVLEEQGFLADTKRPTRR